MSRTSLPIETIVELPPELTGALTFHLPLELFALEAAGASVEVRAAAVEEGLAEAFATGLVDPPFYRWAVDHYADAARRLLDDGPEGRMAAFAEVEPIGAGLVGAAFHGIIRCGYAFMRRDPAELARGLAYLRSRRQVLGGSTAAAGAVGSFPPPEVLDGSTVFEQLDLAAAAAGHDPLCDPARPIAPVRDLAARAADLVAQSPSSFVSIHSLTGLHGLVEVHRAVTGTVPGTDLDRSPLVNWWRAYVEGLRACTVVVGHQPGGGRPRCTVDHRDLGELTAAAVESGDTHSVKLAVALGRLVEADILDLDVALEIGSRKLGAVECTS